MGTTRQVISEWFDRGIQNKNDFMIIVCDTFDHEDYPVFCSSDDFKDIYNRYDGKNMQRIMEVYDLSINKYDQLESIRCYNYPKGFHK